MALGDISVRLSLITDQFSKALENSQKKLNTFATRAASTNKAVVATSGAMTEGYTTLGDRLHKVGASLRDVARISSGIVISQIFYGISRSVREATEALFEFNESLDYARITYSSLFGSTELSNNFLETMQQFSVDTIFEYTDIEGMARKLSAYGIEYQNLMYIIEGLTNIGTISGDSAGLERLAVAIGQINAKGVLKAEEVRQLANAYTPIYDILRDKLGLTDEDLKSIGDLGIPAADAINAIIDYANERFGNAAESAMYTLTGLKNRIVDSLKVMGADILEPITTFYKSLLAYISDGLNNIYDVYKSSGIGGVFEYLVPDKEWQTRIRTFIATIENFVYSVSALLASLWPLIKNTIAKALDIISTIGVVINGFISAVAGVNSSLLSNTTGLNFLTNALLAAAGAWLLLKIQAVGTAAFTAARIAILGLARAVLFLVTSIMAHPLIGMLTILSAVLLGVAINASSSNSAIGNLLNTLRAYSAGGKTTDSILQIGEASEDSADKASEFWNKMSDGADAASDAIDNASSTAKKASKSLLSFDEVYSLTDSSSSTDTDTSALDAISDLAGALSGLGDALIPGIPDFTEYANTFITDLFNSLWEALKKIATGAAEGALIGGLVGFAIGGLVTQTMSGALTGARTGAKWGATIGSIAGAAFAGFWTDIYDEVEESLKKITIASGIGVLVGGLVGFVIGALIGKSTTQPLATAMRGAKIGAGIGGLIGAGIGSFWANATEEVKSSISAIVIGSVEGAFAGGLAGFIIGALIGRGSGANMLDMALRGAKLGATVGTVAGGALGVVFSNLTDDVKEKIKNIAWSAADGALAGGLAGFIIGTLIGTANGSNVLNMALTGAKFGAGIGGVLGGALGSTFDSAEESLEERMDDMFSTVEAVSTGTMIGALAGLIMGAIIGAFVGGIGALPGAKVGATVGATLGSIGSMIYDYLNKSDIMTETSDWFEEESPEITTGLCDGIVESLKDIGTWIYDNIWVPIRDGFKEAFGINSPSTKFKEFGGDCIDGFKEGVSGIWDKIKEKFETLETDISNWFTEKKESIKTWWASWWEPTIEKWDSAWTKVKSWFTTFNSDMSTWFTEKKDSVKTWWSNLWDHSKNKWDSAWTKVKSWFTTFNSDMSAWFTEKKESTKTWWGNLWDHSKNKWDSAWTKVKAWFTTFNSDMSTWFTEKKESVKTWWKSLFDTSKWSSAWSLISGWFSDLKTSISSWFSGLKTSIGTWWNSLWSDKEVNINTNTSTGAGRFSMTGHATGGIFNREHVARFAEGNKAEAVIPLENEAAMQPFVTAISNGILQGLLPAMSTGSSSSNSMPPMYVGTLIADERGLQQLYKKFEVYEAKEAARKGTV